LLEANTGYRGTITGAFHFLRRRQSAWWDKYPNLLVSQSRRARPVCVGIAVGHPDLIEALSDQEQLQLLPADRMAIKAGAAAFEDKAYFCTRETRRKRGTHEAVVVGLQALGFEVLPSAANFTFARHLE
jgi:histidinol-phosphate aminotransferase